MRAMLGAVCLGTLVLGVAGCGSDTMGFDPTLSDHQFFAQISVPTRAVNLATDPQYNTVQLQAVPMFADGTVVPGTVTFTSSSPVVTVSPSGLVTATGATNSPALVAIAMTYKGVTRSDTVRVNVMRGAPAAPIQSLSIQPLPGDSAKMGVGDFSGVYMLNTVVRDTHGDPVSGIVIDYTSSDSLTAKFVAPGVITVLRPGVVTLHATTYAYGVAKSDSLEFTVGQAVNAFVNVVQQTQTGQKNSLLVFEPGTLTIGVGGTIIWINSLTPLVDVVFDDPSSVASANLPGFFGLFYNGHPGSGNIPAFGAEYDSTGTVIFPSTTAARTFNKAGTYNYHSQLYGTRGTIIVCDERAALCPR